MTQNSAIPPLLRPGDRVRVVAPSGPVRADAFRAGIECIEAFGLVPVYAEEVMTRDGFLAGSDERRLTELETAMADPAARCIWAARGGYGATRLLPHLTIEMVSKAPKWLLGFSDVTVLHALWQRAGVQSVHGANVTSLWQWDADGLEELQTLLFEGQRPPIQGDGGIGAATVTGPLVGGNLTMLGALAGTPYFADLKGSILLIEDVREPPYKIDRVFTQLDQAGAFDGLLGVAVGQLTRCDDALEGSEPRSGLDVVRAQVQRLSLPAVWGLPIGHEAHSRAVPLGAPAVLDPITASLRFPV